MELKRWGILVPRNGVSGLSTYCLLGLVRLHFGCFGEMNGGRRMRSVGTGRSTFQVMFVAVSAVLLLCLFPHPTWAQQQDPALSEFIGEIRVGLALQDEAARAKALMGLYYFEGADEEVGNRQQGILGNLFRDSTIAFKTVVPLAELPEYVADGVRYAPNLQPSGNVVLEISPVAATHSNGFDFTTTIPFGQTDDGRYRFIAKVKRSVKVDAPKDRWITIMLSGTGDTGGRLGFPGACTLQQSDGTVRQIKIEDEGLLSYSVGWRGIGITDCLIEKTANSGALRLQLMRDDEKFFDQTFFEDFPATFPGR